MTIEIETTVSGSSALERRRRRRIRGLLIGGILLLACSFLSLAIGVRPVSLQSTFEAFTAFDQENSEHLLVWHLRLPRTLLAIVAGAALGVAGAIMQALTRNPLADPGIFGVNGGAAAAIVIGIAFFGVSTIVGYMVLGMIGAALAGTAVYLLGGVRQGTNPVRLVLAGAALSVVLMSLTQIVLVNSEEEVFDQFRHWTVGSIQGRGFDILLPITLLAALGLLLSFTLTKALDTVALGEDLGKALGISPRRTVTLSALSVVILAGAATAAAGPIGFIGLIAPHLARFITGPDHRWVIPYSVMISAVLMVSADTLGRVVAHPSEVGVGIMVALIGGPFFVALVRRRKIVQL